MFRLLHASAALEVGDYNCPGGGDGACQELTDRFELVFVRRGTFSVHLGEEDLLLTPAHALLLRPGTAYRATHPVGGGDDCTVFRFSSQGWETVDPLIRTAFRRPRAVAAPSSFLRQQRLLQKLSRPGFDRLGAEEGAWNVVHDFGERFALARSGRPSDQARRAVRAAQELIASHYSETLSLESVARAAGMSPFHLCRAFRDVTGTTIHRFQTMLRLRASLLRLEEGESDLTTLALDLGFSDHSHFTGAFGREFGMSPSKYRALSKRSRTNRIDHAT